MSASDPHAGGRLLAAGPDPHAARAVTVLVHGRGGSARDMLGLAAAIGRDDVAYLAPEAAGHTWYPQSFLAPLEANEPGLSSGIARLETIVGELAGAGVPNERVALAGFSQGACLVLETVARHPRRYGGVAGLTGGLVGPVGTPRLYPGSLAGTPVLLTAGDPDPHVPWPRVEETARVLATMGAEVDLRRFPGRPHTIGAEELTALGALVEAIATASQ